MTFRPLLAIALAAVVSTLGAGCLGPDDEGSSPSGTSASETKKPVVVALIDTGVNPYHEAFRAHPGGVSVGNLPVALSGVVMANLSSAGSYEDRRAADGDFWDAVELGQLYGFPGTRLLAVSTSHHAGRHAILDGSNHGTGTAALVAREAPDALIVMVQFDTTICDPSRPEDECSILSKAAPAMAWAAEQPWIDVISVSIGDPVNVPFHPAADPGMKPFLDASRLAHDRGKLVVVGSGNTVAPPLAAYYGGPPWVVAVGGVVPSTRGETAQASKGVDVVANFTEYVPTQDSTNESQWKGGTSYSAPIVAGVLAKAMATTRAQGKVATSQELRDALNVTAIHFQATEWNPSNFPTNEPLYNAAWQSLPVIVPFAQMGWGYVHGDMATEIARRVLESDFAFGPEKAATAQYQAQWQALREAYWQQYL